MTSPILIGKVNFAFTHCMFLHGLWPEYELSDKIDMIVVKNVVRRVIHFYPYTIVTFCTWTCWMLMRGMIMIIIRWNQSNNQTIITYCSRNLYRDFFMKFARSTTYWYRKMMGYKLVGVTWKKFGVFLPRPLPTLMQILFLLNDI